MNTGVLENRMKRARKVVDGTIVEGNNGGLYIEHEDETRFWYNWSKYAEQEDIRLPHVMLSPSIGEHVRMETDELNYIYKLWRLDFPETDAEPKFGSAPQRFVASSVNEPAKASIFSTKEIRRKSSLEYALTLITSAVGTDDTLTEIGAVLEVASRINRWLETGIDGEPEEQPKMTGASGAGTPVVVPASFSVETEDSSTQSENKDSLIVATF